MPAVYLGLDLGGTNIKAGVVDGSGKIVATVSVPTGRSGRDLTSGLVIERMITAGNQAIEKAGVRRENVAAAGVLSPGQASLERGIVFRSANLPLWRNVPLRARVSAGLGMPAVLENDANAAAYGEWWVGAGSRRARGKTEIHLLQSGQPLQNLFMFTLGTGVGGGLIYQGRVVRGAHDFATEVGHMVMIPRELGGEKCGCGQYGCLERYCSAKYSAGRATRMLVESKKLRKKSSLGKVFKEKGVIHSEDIVAHAKAGDAFALECWHETCRILALACINVCHMVDPQMIVIGGGMSRAGRYLLDLVIRYYHGQWWKMTKPTAKIVLAKLGNDAGVIGAAGVAREACDRGVLPKVGE
jgi:glucokinase